MSTPAEVTISRMSEPEVIRLKLEIGKELIDVDMSLEEFARCVTGRGAAKGLVARRIVKGGT